MANVSAINNVILKEELLTGNLVEDFQRAVFENAKSKSELASNLGLQSQSELATDAYNSAVVMMGQIKTLINSVGNNPGQILTARLATETTDNSAITAKIGQLLDDARIPSPAVGQILPVLRTDASKIKLNSTLSTIDRLEQQREVVVATLGQVTVEQKQRTDVIPNVNVKVTIAQRQIADIDQAIDRSSREYSQLIKRA